MRNQRLFREHLLLDELRLATAWPRHVDLLWKVDELVLSTVLTDARENLPYVRGDSPILNWLRTVCRLPELEILRLVLAV